MIKTMTSSCR